MNVFDLDFLGSKANIRTILCLLDKNGEKEAMYEAEIAHIIHMSPTGVSNTLDALIEENLVKFKKISYVTIYWLDKEEFYKRIGGLRK